MQNTPGFPADAPVLADLRSKIHILDHLAPDGKPNPSDENELVDRLRKDIAAEMEIMRSQLRLPSRPKIPQTSPE